MEEEDEVHGAVEQEYASGNVVQDQKTSQRNGSQYGELGQCDTIEYGLEVHVSLREDASAQHNDCVEDQVKVHVLGVL